MSISRNIIVACALSMPCVAYPDAPAWLDRDRIVERTDRRVPSNVRQVVPDLKRERRPTDTLIFDEGETYYGKRSDIPDAHDRYENVETGSPPRKQGNRCKNSSRCVD